MNYNLILGKTIMRSFLYIFTIALSFQFVCANNVHGQKLKEANISYTVRNESISEIFNQLTRLTGYNFFYDQSLIEETENVTISIKNGSIDNILNELSLKTGLQFKKINNTISVSREDITQPKIPVITQESKTITGIVTDERGEPIIGANVVEKGTVNGVATDIDGKYHINIKSGSILSVSYIGYLSQDVTVGNQTVINVTLNEDLLKLDEVVVVGYGTARKSDLAGAVVRADLSILQESPSTNILSSLQGTIPGLNIGSVAEAGKDPSMSIRGRTSISGTQNPLIVLDGIIFRGNIIDINTNDVESIDILKDASAAAIYGSEASNGVILITSKTGKVKSKPIIAYSGSFSYQQPTNKDMVPEGREGFLRKVADRHLSESRIGDDMLQMNPDWNPGKYMMDRNALEGYDNGVETDWWDLLTNDTPYIQNHSLSVRGRSEDIGYFFSMNYLDQENLIINDQYQRYSVRANLDMKITDWLTVGTQSFFNMSDMSGVSPTLSDVVNLPPLVAVRDEEGELIKQPYKTTLNPLLTVQRDNVNKRYHLSGNFYLDLKIPYIKGFNYRLNFSQNYITSQQFDFNKWGANFQGEGSKRNSSQYTWMLDNLFTYQRVFDKHSVNATFVYGAEKRKYEATKASASIFVNDILGYNKLSVGQADIQKAESEAWQESSLYMMLRAMYTYNDRYTFTGTIRRDGFSGFGKNNKFGVFPSAAVAWRISEESFFKDNISWAENLKLRLSYGKNGNRTVGRYQTLSQLSAQTGYLYGDGGSPEQMQWISSLANADLKWETTNTFNVGLDFSVLNGRIFGNMEYYTAQTNNLLYDINIPQINGFTKIPTNIGKMNNKGFELSITGRAIETKDFSWDITFNYSRNRNKVKSILGIDADGDGKEDDLISNKIFIGKPYGVCYDYNIIGMWQIEDVRNGNVPSGFTYGTYKIEDIDGDGKYTADNDRKILGYTDPSYRFGINNSFRYKDWEFKFFINSIQGGKDYYYGQPGSGLMNPDNIFQNNSFKFDYWTPENPNARYRQIGYYNQTTGYGFSPYVQRNFIRLQDVTLSYNVPKAFLKKINFSQLKVYVTGKNLLTITDWDGWDPETGTGLSYGAYPLMKSYSVGLNIEF